MDPTEKKQLVQEQLDLLRESVEELKEQKLNGYETAAGGYYDPYAGITFGSGKYSNTVIGGPGLTSPATYTISSAVGATWSAGTSSTVTSGKLTLLGDDADLVINGRSLTDTLRALEERLNILVPNNQLEKEWDELRALGDQYRALEAKLKEQGDMWNKLKAMPPPPL